MKDTKRITYGRTSVYNLNYHLIWGTKYRNKVLKCQFKLGRLQQLIEFFGQVTKEDLEWRFPPQTFPGTPI